MKHRITLRLVLVLSCLTSCSQQEVMESAAPTPSPSQTAVQTPPVAAIPTPAPAPSGNSETPSMKVVPISWDDKRWVAEMIVWSDELDYAFASGDKLRYIVTAAKWSKEFIATRRLLPAGVVQTALYEMSSSYFDIAMLYQADYGNVTESERLEIAARHGSKGLPEEELPSKMQLKARTIKLHLTKILKNSPTKN